MGRTKSLVYGVHEQPQSESSGLGASEEGELRENVLKSMHGHERRPDYSDDLSRLASAVVNQLATVIEAWPGVNNIKIVCTMMTNLTKT